MSIFGIKLVDGSKKGLDNMEKCQFLELNWLTGQKKGLNNMEKCQFLKLNWLSQSIEQFLFIYF
jgi:hypothetical protein